MGLTRGQAKLSSFMAKRRNRLLGGRRTGLRHSARALRLPRWAAGHWGLVGLWGGHEYGDRAKAAADGIFGLSFSSLVNAATASRRFESPRRRGRCPA
jgi:hypothetical protein